MMPPIRRVHGLGDVEGSGGSTGARTSWARTTQFRIFLFYTEYLMIGRAGASSRSGVKSTITKTARWSKETVFGCVFVRRPFVTGKVNHPVNTFLHLPNHFNKRRVDATEPCAMSAVCLIPDQDIISPFNLIRAFNLSILILFYINIRGVSWIKAQCCWCESNIMGLLNGPLGDGGSLTSESEQGLWARFI